MLWKNFAKFTTLWNTWLLKDNTTWARVKHSSLDPLLPVSSIQYRDTDLFLKQDLAPTHGDKTTSNWSADDGITVLVLVIHQYWRIYMVLSRGTWETSDLTIQMLGLLLITWTKRKPTGGILCGQIKQKLHCDIPVLCLEARGWCLQHQGHQTYCQACWW